MILVVEDDPQVARLIALVLKRSGYEGEVVSDGAEALARIEASPPQLVFADLSLRGMGGDVLCQRVKGREATRQIPFIVVSGDRDIAEKATTCGADDYIGKPFEFEQLLRLVKKYVETENRSSD